ncbi:MAG: glycosyltransferase [Cyclobacteriaceae bacterium]
MKVYLFTYAYPYGTTEAFLAYELEVLSRLKGLKITIIPRVISGNKRMIPKNVEVDSSYADYVLQNHEKKVLPLFRNLKYLLKGLFSVPKVSMSAFQDVAAFIHYGQNMVRWVRRTQLEPGICYTYWCDVEAYGLSLIKENGELSNPMVSRAHGFDVYDERRSHGFIPFRKQVLNRLDRLFCVSEDGKKYLTAKYRVKNIELSRLGVKQPEVLNPSAETEDITIVSCSMLVKVKRMNLIKDSILAVADLNQTRNFTWVHFGGSKEEFSRILPNHLSGNLRVKHKGQVDNEEIHHFYASEHVDMLINLSSSEGVPVSMMEAISYGIPVVATDVGGVSEIINSDNGKLLSPNPEPSEVANAIIYIKGNSRLRSGARDVFARYFDGATNYSNFARQLSKLNQLDG